LRGASSASDEAIPDHLASCPFVASASHLTPDTSHLPLTDTHCHLDFDEFAQDRPAVVQRALDAGVTRILIPSVNLHSSESALALAETQPFLFAAVGCHPTHAAEFQPDTLTRLRELLSVQSAAGRVVALGEIGLDYYWDSAPHDLQRQVLKEQLSLAEELDFPVIIHSREQHDSEGGPCASDLLEILQGWIAGLNQRNAPLASRPGVLHSFSGSLDAAQDALRLGFYIGVTGPITYKNADRRRNVVASLPLDHLLVETDSPFLAPVPHRGRRNEPAFVEHIADKIADIHMTTREQVAVVTSANAGHLFRWGG